jgi:hypothetical protein
MKRFRLALALVGVATVAACTDSPSPVLPAGASYDGGHTLGSGGGMPPATASGDAVAGDSLGRSGHTLGSGG